jgi:asparagine synthase (glutamine-hydrolysing)
MESDCGRYSIIYNGEIYNYIELRQKLDGQGFRTNTDTEVLLRLYREHGPDCLQLLRGMFAFAIRDNETGEVFLARDRLGIKPLYYYSSEGVFAFCSELRGLLASGLMPRVLDPVSLNSYLSFGAVQEPRTIIENVRALPPAHYMMVSAAGEILKIGRYWALPPVNRSIGREEAIEETRARLDESVRLHLAADVPLGAFLSGGLDSSAIVALMSRHAAGWVKTFTVCFPEREFSEQALARKVAQQYQTEHVEIQLSEDEMLGSLPEAVSAIDQPTIDGINTWVISRATKRGGITVALSGLGGDELFGGYPSFGRARLLSRYRGAINWLGSPARGRLGRLTSAVMGDSVRGQKLGATIAAGADLLASYWNTRGLFSRSSREKLIVSIDHARASRDYDIPADTLELISGFANMNVDGEVFNLVSRCEMGFYMGNMLLRDTDAMSMASSLEVRVPLLDHRVVEWVSSLPGAMKTGRHAKQLLIDALGPELPREIAARRKMGFALPFERWLRTSLRPFLSETLNDTSAVASAGLHPGEVAGILDLFDRGSRATSWSRVWALAVLVDWSRRHQVRAE